MGQWEADRVYGRGPWSKSRIATMGGALGLLAWAMRRESVVGRALAASVAGGLVYKAVTGQSVVRLMRLSRFGAQAEQRRSSADAGVILRTLTIQRPPEEVYGFWRDPSNLARFMQHLESVERIDERRSHWRVKGPMGVEVEFDSELVHDVPNRELAWRSLPDADIENWGRVRFTPMSDGRATRLEVRMHFAGPTGRVGAAVAKLFGEEPQMQAEEDLMRLKQLLESGDATPKRTGDGSDATRNADSPPTDSAIAARSGLASASPVASATQGRGTASDGAAGVPPAASSSTTRPSPGAPGV